MTSALNYYLLLFLCIFLPFVHGNQKGLTTAQRKACEAVFDPEVMKTSCCSPMDQIVEKIGTCQNRSNSEVFSCKVSNCVVGEEYKILTNCKVDETKVKTVIINLDEKQPDSKPLNAKITQNCLHGQYKQYVANGKCDSIKFQTCAFVNYLFGCQYFESAPQRCSTLSNNVRICSSVLQKYLDFTNNKIC